MVINIRGIFWTGNRTTMSKDHNIRISFFSCCSHSVDKICTFLKRYFLGVFGTDSATCCKTHMTDHYVKSCFTDHCSLFFIKCITDCEKPKLFCFDKSFDFFVVAHPCVFELFTISPIDKTNCRKVHYSRKPDVDQIFQKRFHYTCWIASADTGNHWRFFNLREHSVCKLRFAAGSDERL